LTRLSEKASAARLSVIGSAVLIVLKLSVGWRIGSVAVVSEALHSSADLVAALIAFFAVKVADTPPDDDHPYGHGKVESLSGLVEAILIACAAAYIAFEAIHVLQSDRVATALGPGIFVMVFSALVNAGISVNLLRVARRTESPALAADARHLLVDVWTSIGVGIGLTLAHFTGIRWLDPISALIVAVIVLHAAYSVARDAILPLTDIALPREEIEAFEKIMVSDSRILGFHKLRTRRAGSHRLVDVHIQVDDEMSLREAHALTEEIEDQLRACLPNTHVMIHTEPFEEEQRHHAENPH
jgi:cation diffusion facilitator family transporter